MGRHTIKVKKDDKLLCENWSGDLFTKGSVYTVTEVHGNIFSVITNYSDTTSFRMNNFGYSFRKVYKNDKTSY